MQRMRRGRHVGAGAVVVSAATVFAIAGAAVADVIYVPDDHPTIQQAIDAATTGDEVVVRDGTYTGAGNRDIDFRGKAIMVRSESRDPTRCVIDVEHAGRGFVFVSGETRDSVLEAITVTRARGLETGGGILCENSSPTIRRCFLIDNEVGGPTHGIGGGMYHAGGSPLIFACVFEGNRASGLCNGQGGGLYSCGPARIVRCEFIDNRASGGSCAGNGRAAGGGISGCEYIVDDCRFVGNRAAASGGQISAARGGAIEGTLVEIWNSTIKENLASAATFDSNDAVARGGGLAIRRSQVRNCTIALNEADGDSPFGGEAYGGGVYVTGDDDDDVSVLLDFSMVRNVADGNGGPAEGGGLHVDTACGSHNFVDGAFCGNVPDAVCDACAACVASQACPPCHGDVDLDQQVDWDDLARVLAAWGPCDDPNACPADRDGDGLVGYLDLLLVLARWGECPVGGA